MLARRRVYGREPDERMSGQARQEFLRTRTPTRQIPTVEASEFAEANGRLDFRHAKVVADPAMDIGRAPGLEPKAQFRANVIAVVSQRPDFTCQRIVIAADHAALAARRDVLRLAKGKAAHRAERTDLAALVDAAHALGAVFNHEKASALRQAQNRIHVHHPTVKVDDHNGFRARRQARRDLLGINEMIRSDIAENRESPRLKNAERGRDERIGRTDNFVAGANAKCCESDMEGRRTAGDGNGMPNAEPFGPRGLEPKPHGPRPVVDAPRMQDVQDNAIRPAVKLRPRRESARPGLLSALKGQLL